MRPNLQTGVCLALCLFAASLALAAENPQFDQARSRSRAMAETLQSYEIHAALVMDQKPRGAAQGMKLEADQTAAARMPNRLLVKVESPMFSQTWGVGAENSWFFLPQAKAVYLGKPLTLGRDLDSEAEGGLDEKFLYNFYAGISEFLLTSDVDVAEGVESKSLTVNGKDVDCQVFAFTITGEGRRFPRRGNGEYWFGPGQRPGAAQPS